MVEFILAVVLGLLFAFGTFLVLRRDIVRVVWGVTIIAQAANLYLVTMGFGLTGDPESDAPLLTGGASAPFADPLVQALVLTAIVIGFGTTAFALVLTYRVYEENGTIDLEDLASNPFEGPAAEAANARADGGTRAATTDAHPDPAEDRTDRPTDGGER
jgi:Multisubunit Na+/H+ antiporter, MnhC subunit